MSYFDELYPKVKESWWRLKLLLEFLSNSNGLKLFDGEEFFAPRDLLNESDFKDLLDLEVKCNEEGIFDFYVSTERPLFTFALPCPNCGRMVEIILSRKVLAEEFCGCTGHR